MLMHHELLDIPAKQIDRWEGEGGFVPTEPKPRGRFPLAAVEHAISPSRAERA